MLITKPMAFGQMNSLAVESQAQLAFRRHILQLLKLHIGTLAERVAGLAGRRRC